jgi:hypothetical protein
MSFNFHAGVKYTSVFIEDFPYVPSIVSFLTSNPEQLKKVEKIIQIQTGFTDTDERIPSRDLIFSRLFVYTPFKMHNNLKQHLVAEAKKMEINLVIRDGNYLAQRSKMERPVAFISHDSRDKDAFVRELASNLQKMLCTVWYDEFSLVPGQSLRSSIEYGLKTCKKCVLVLSKNFIENQGWTKAEFDSIFTREILEQKNVVVPVWHGVTKHEVYEYCPRLVDRVAIISSIGPEEVAKKVMLGINRD